MARALNGIRCVAAILDEARRNGESIRSRFHDARQRAVLSALREDYRRQSLFTRLRSSFSLSHISPLRKDTHHALARRNSVFRNACSAETVGLVTVFPLGCSGAAPGDRNAIGGGQEALAALTTLIERISIMICRTIPCYFRRLRLLTLVFMASLGCGADGASGLVETSRSVAPLNLVDPAGQRQHPRSIGPQREPFPSTFIDVRDYGAQCNAVTDDTAAILQAIDAADALPGGGEVHFPSGICVVTQLILSDKKVALVGQGGTCDTFEPGDQRFPGNKLNCATTIRSATNATIVKFTTADKTGIKPSRFWVGVRDLAIQGNGTAKDSMQSDPPNDQHCLQIDNQGLNVYNVTLVHCGGHGLYITFGESSSFHNLSSWFNNGDGINIQHATANNFYTGQSAYNGGDGFRLDNSVWGVSTFGYVVEGNLGYGINLVGADPGSVRFNRFMSVWDEVNKSGSVHFTDNAFDNVVDYVRYSSDPPVWNTVHNANLVSGSNISGKGPGLDGIPYNSFRRILSVPQDSSHDDQINIRDRDDINDGIVQLATLKATYGGTETGLARAGAIRVTNGRGISSRNLANTQDIELITSTTSDMVVVGVGAAAVVVAPGLVQFQTALQFADLPAGQPNGSMAYCSDCTTTNPCADGGTGAIAKRLNGSWVCN